MAIRDYRAQTTAPGPARAPQYSIRAAADTSGLDAMGQGMEEVGATLERARQETELTDARLALTEGIGQINQDLSQDEQFGDMGERYNERLTELQTEVMGRVSSENLRRQLSIETARARVAAEARVINRQQTLQGSHARATLSRTLRSTASQVPNAESPEEQDLAYARANASIDSLLEAGHLTAEEAEAARVQLDEDISTGLVMGAMNADPAAAAEELATPGAYGLEEVDRQRYLAQAQRQAEQIARTERRDLERRVDTARGVLVRGGTLDTEDLAALREDAAGTDLAGLLEASIEARKQLGDFATATPSERQAYIETVRSQGVRIDDATIDKAELATLEAVDAKLANTEEAELKAVGERVREAVTALGDGREVADIDAIRQAAAGTPFAAELDLAERRRSFVEEYRRADRETQRQLLAEAREAGVMSEQRVPDEAFLDALERIDENARTAIADEPIDYAIDQGLAGAQPLDLSDPSSVRARMGLVEEMVGSYGAEPMVLTQSERRRFKKVANEGSTEEQLSFVVSVIDGFGEGAEAVFDEIDGLDPVVRRAGDLVFETGDDEVAGIILAGRKAMDAGDEMTVPNMEAVAVWEETLDGVLGNVPGRREEVIEAAKAYYARMAPGKIESTDIDGQVELLTEGVQRVLGGSKLRGDLYGGIQEVNGRRVRLPAALDRRSTERLLGSSDLEDWRAASLSGNAPHEGEAEIRPEDAVLQWVRGSVYRVGVRSNRGQVEWYRDPGVDNGYFYVDLDRLSQAYLKRQSTPRPVTNTPPEAPEHIQRLGGGNG